VTGVKVQVKQTVPDKRQVQIMLTKTKRRNNDLCDFIYSSYSSA